MEHVGIVRHCGECGIIIDATELLSQVFAARQAGLLYAIERDNAAPLWAATAKGLNLLEEVGEVEVVCRP